ncbi:interferon alpha-inducible protein 27-like protein 2A [Simochromis diagramma]|uniref:interferon alpha-inducible protein 27-like protein 2A n=1 Tax=Simochromis diagramma TaxID=43689 RepID=UPI001A7E3B9F|nr:interferon alpha-inducible protein 27-like protein 2A [Simochromis diagramma]
MDWEEIWSRYSRRRCWHCGSGSSHSGCTGFTPAGIAAGSIAAKLMSYFAVSNGGGVAAGGLIATLQSWGMGGLTGAGIGGVAGAGGTVGWMLSTICNQTGTR